MPPDTSNQVHYSNDKIAKRFVLHILYKWVQLHTNVPHVLFKLVCLEQQPLLGSSHSTTMGIFWLHTNCMQNKERVIRNCYPCMV